MRRFVRRRGCAVAALCGALVLPSACMSLEPVPDMPLPISRIDRERAYASLDQAAVAALRLAMSVTRAYEWGGALFRCGSDYYPSLPVTIGDPHRVRFRVATPSGCELAGIFHTHTSGSDAEQFSPEDVEVMRSFGVPSYLGVTMTGAVRVLRPGMERKDLSYPVSTERFVSSSGQRVI